MDKRGVRCAATGLLLLAAATVAFGCLASPLSPETTPSLRDEGAAANDFDKRLTPVGEATQEVRRTGPGISPSLLGIDEGALSQGSLLYSEVREQDFEQTLWAGRPGSTRNFDSGTPDIFRDTISSALRATRDAFFEGGDTASFSLAGVELSVTLRGERRGISLNGYDVMVGTNQYATDEATARAAEGAIGHTPQEIAIRQYQIDDATGPFKLANILADVRGVASDPMAIVGVLALLGIWVMLAMASSRRT